MRQERGLILNSLALRIIGMVTMTIDHIGIFLLNYGVYMEDPTLATNVGRAFRIIGRIAFPIFIFLLSEGMRHTRSKEKYLLRIAAVFILIMSAQLILIFGMNEYAASYTTNPFMDLLLCGLVLYCLTKKGPLKLLSLLPASILIASFAICCYENIFDLTITWWPYAFRPAYSLLGLGAAIGFYYAPKIVVATFHSINQEQGISDEVYLETGYGRKNANMFGCLFLLITVLALWGLSYLNGRILDTMDMSTQAWCLLAILPLFLYNGNKGPGGRILQIFNYAYFPLHIVFIYLIFQAIIGA